MDKREAKRSAHRWVSAVIEGALLNGAGDYFGADNDTDVERVRSAIREIQHEHDRKGDR